jgi:hypothetical protein
VYILTERVEEVGHMAGLFFSYDRIARKTQFLTMDTLRDRKRQQVPFFIPLLLMRRYGIMNLSLHTMTEQEVLQFVAARA